MKFIDRLIFIIVGILFVALAAGCVLLAVNFISISDIIAFIGKIRIDITEQAILFVAAAVLLIFGLKIVFARPKKIKIAAYTIRKSDDGDVAVSLKAIENTIKLAVAHYKEIKDVKLKVTANDAGISISAKLAIPTGVVLPELLDSFKVYLKEFVETHTGAPVHKIRFIATEFKPVDPDNERKKMAAKAAKAAKESAPKKQADAYASTHATVLPKADVVLVDEDVIDSIDVDDDDIIDEQNA